MSKPMSKKRKPRLLGSLATFMVYLANPPGLTDQEVHHFLRHDPRYAHFRLKNRKTVYRIIKDLESRGWIEPTFTYWDKKEKRVRRAGNRKSFTIYGWDRFRGVCEGEAPDVKRFNKMQKELPFSHIKTEPPTPVGENSVMRVSATATVKADGAPIVIDKTARLKLDICLEDFKEVGLHYFEGVSEDKDIEWTIYARGSRKRITEEKEVE